MQKYWLGLVVYSTLAILLYIYLFFGDTGTLPVLPDKIDAYLWSIFLVNLLGYSIYRTDILLSHITPWRQSFGKRFFFGLIVNLIIAYAIIYLGIITFLIIKGAVINISGLISLHSDAILKFIVISFILLFFHTISDFAAFSFKQYTHVQIESARLKREQMSLRYEALKSQLSPHYLFNSLNTISSLIYRDKEVAEGFIRKLARSYTQILKTSDKKLITLSEEIEIIKAYKYLMEIRFEDAFLAQIELTNDELDLLLPPLSVQMLFENAIKHNALSVETPLNIRCYVEDDYIVVTHNYIGKPFYLKIDNTLVENPRKTGSFNIGLENIKKRYAFYTGKKVIIEKNENFTVKLPVLKNMNEK